MAAAEPSQTRSCPRRVCPCAQAMGDAGGTDALRRAAGFCGVAPTNSCGTPTTSSGAGPGGVRRAYHPHCKDSCAGCLSRPDNSASTMGNKYAAVGVSREGAYGRNAGILRFTRRRRFSDFTLNRGLWCRANAGNRSPDRQGNSLWVMLRLGDGWMDSCCSLRSTPCWGVTSLLVPKTAQPSHNSPSAPWNNSCALEAL